MPLPTNIESIISDSQIDAESVISGSQIGAESVISDSQIDAESVISDPQTNTENLTNVYKSKKMKTSWIWKYFKEEIIVQDNKEIKTIVCQEKIDGTICGTTYIYSGGSTGNATTHLYSRHNITKTGKINKVCLKNLLDLLLF